MQKFDIIVIGGGPGGYVCAIRAAQLGLKVALAEKVPHLGGTCLNVGCIPSKALLHSTELYQQALHGKSHGLVVSEVRMEVSGLMERKNKVVEQLRTGVKTLVAKRGIEVFYGEASFVDAKTVQVASGKEPVQLQADNIVIATGSVPVELPFLPFDEKDILSSTGALKLDRVPSSMVVVGAGAIGLEMGSVWARLGTEVTVVEFLPNIAAGSDDDVSKLAERIFKKQGLKFNTETKVTGVTRTEKGLLELQAERKGKAVTFIAEKILVSVGRKPYTEGLNLSAAGLTTDSKGRIPVKELRTSVPGIWAIGDVVEGPMLAHKAEEDGVAAAEWIAGKHAHLDYSLVPNVIYTHPEIAAVGLTEKQAKDKGLDFKVGKFQLVANGRAIAQDATDGMAKVIACSKTDRILGVAIIGAGASEMIASAVAHMTYGGSAEDLGKTVHAHPTISESLKEAALAVDKAAIHGL
ncbi:MAG: dihydrolipoyl dehydrogenase [Verrucomicrobia bacterium]|nr:dihydrolipoyl dehydrogenase [Verrucomicrobiota bacterium]